MAGYTTNALGYGVNDAVSKGPVPIFWGGDAHVKSGFSISYQRNIFHARKVFAMDWGLHTGIWKSRDKGETIFTLSLNPVLRFNAVRSRNADFSWNMRWPGLRLFQKQKLTMCHLAANSPFMILWELVFLPVRKKNCGWYTNCSLLQWKPLSAKRWCKNSVDV